MNAGTDIIINDFFYDYNVLDVVKILLRNIKFLLTCVFLFQSETIKNVVYKDVFLSFTFSNQIKREKETHLK